MRRKREVLKIIEKNIKGDQFEQSRFINLSFSRDKLIVILLQINKRLSSIRRLYIKEK